MTSPDILAAAVLNGLMSGAVYALIAVGLTLVYGVLHIINFAHGAMLSAAMFAAYLAFQAGIDPYAAMVPLALIFFGLGYGLQRLVIGPASHGDDQNILLITLGLSIVIENLLLAVFNSDTRTVDVAYGFSTLDLGFTFLAVPRAVAFGVSCLVAVLLWILLAHTDTGKAIRAVAKEKLGASLTGTYVLVAFTIVVLGGMGSIPGAIAGGLFVGVVESVSGLMFGESLGQLGIFVIFILVLLIRPTGLFGAKA
jgi:branched-chain amino acid transport system permease protein